MDIVSLYTCDGDNYQVAQGTVEGNRCRLDRLDTVTEDGLDEVLFQEGIQIVNVLPTNVGTIVHGTAEYGLEVEKEIDRLAFRNSPEYINRPCFIHRTLPNTNGHDVEFYFAEKTETDRVTPFASLFEKIVPAYDAMRALYSLAMPALPKEVVMLINFDGERIRYQIMHRNVCVGFVHSGKVEDIESYDLVEDVNRKLRDQRRAGLGQPGLILTYGIPSHNRIQQVVEITTQEINLTQGIETDLEIPPEFTYVTAGLLTLQDGMDFKKAKELIHRQSRLTMGGLPPGLQQLDGRDFRELFALLIKPKK